MIRTQIQITNEQARALKRMAAKEGKSMAELIRRGISRLLKEEGQKSDETVRRRAIMAVGSLSGPADLAENHDRYLAEALDQ